MTPPPSPAGPPPATTPATLDATLVAAVDRCAAARPLVLLLDVDGTLAPIVRRPEDARVPDATLATLAALAALDDTHLVLVTGRTPDSARRLVPIAGAWIVGNHGAEQLAPDGTHRVAPEVAAHGPTLRAAADALAPLAAAVPGVWVEDKGWSLSLHYRQAAPADWPRVAEATAAVAARFGLRAGGGKQVVELRAPVAVDKGTAGVALARTLGADAPAGAAIAAGDDVTDEDLFVRGRAELPRCVTVRVGGGETAAEWRVEDPGEFAAVLGRVVEGRTGRA